MLDNRRAQHKFTTTHTTTPQAKSQFKSRSIANNVDIIIPVPSDVDTPSFKASIGTVTYLPDKVFLSAVCLCAVNR